MQLPVRMIAKGVRGENGSEFYVEVLARKYTHPSPWVFCESLSKEKGCGNECAQVCENKGAEKWVVCGLSAQEDKE